MTILGVLIVFILYFTLLIAVSRFTANKGSTNDTFFTGDRRSPWIIVAYGMIGTLLSGVTFMSVPGYVRESHFTYLGVVLGNFAGVFVIAFFLLPLYYRLNLTSIYSYLRERFGPKSEKSGALLFIISRLMGSALRMYLVVFILYEFFFKEAGFPFFVLTAILIGMILLYTYRGGIKTVVWTDVLQTTAMLLALAGTVFILVTGMGCPVSEVFSDAAADGMMTVYDGDWRSSTFFWKQFSSGVAGMIAMTGLDQDMMQKNLSCDNLKNSQKNMSLTAVLLLLMNALFLILGVLLIYYADRNGIILPEKSDAIFSTIALSANTVSAVLFIVGLVAAGFSSADGSLTSLTTSFCINILDFEKNTELSESRKTGIRKAVHIVFALLFFTIIVVFKPFHSDSIISTIFKIAGFTYGPLLGMFFFGMVLGNRRVNDGAVPYIAVISPVASYLIDRYSEVLLFGYHFGFEILLLNALLTVIGLYIFSSARTE